MKKYLKKINDNGFTLIELLVVIAIIGLLSSIIISSLNSARAKGRDVIRLQDLKEFSKGLEMFYDKYGVYPCGDTFGWSIYGGADIFLDGSGSCPFLDGTDNGNPCRIPPHGPISCAYPEWGLYTEKLYPTRHPRDPLKEVNGYEYTYSASANRQTYLLQSRLEMNTEAMQNDGGLCPTTYEFGPGLRNTDFLKPGLNCLP